MKSAVLLRAISGQMKIHLNLTLNEGSSYQKIREAIIAFDAATTKWNEAGAGALAFSSTSPIQQDYSGVAPMEIDRLQQKGDGKKGKQKGKDDKGKGKGKSGKTNYGKEGKGKGGKQNAGKEGKEKGGKEQKGKSKGQNNEVCWACGKPGHQAKDCWRVRQVEAPTTQSISGASQNTTSPSTTTTGTTSGGDPTLSFTASDSL